MYHLLTSCSWGSIGHTEHRILCFNNSWVLYVLYFFHLEWKVIKLLELLELAAHFFMTCIMGTMTKGGEGGGGTPNCRRWSNGGKNQNPKKSLEKKLTPQKCQAEFALLRWHKTSLAVLCSQNYSAWIRGRALPGTFWIPKRVPT